MIVERVCRWDFWQILAASLVLTVLSTGRVWAQVDESVVLDFQSPNGCGSREQVLARLAALRGTTQASPIRVDATIVVKPSKRGYLVSFKAEKDATRSQRELVVTDCAAATEAGALLLHFTLDPELAALAGASALTAAPSSEPSTPTPTAEDEQPNDSTSEAEVSEAEAERPLEAPEARPVDSTPRNASNESVTPPSELLDSDFEARDASLYAPRAPLPWFGLSAAVVGGVAPRWSAGAGLEAGVLIGGWSLQLQATYHPVPDVQVPGVDAATLESALLRIAVFGGPVWGTRAFHVGPILGLGVERLSATPRGISSPRSGVSTWWSAAAGANLQLQVHAGLGLNLRGGALASLQRPKFTVDGVPGLVHQPSRLGWWTTLGVVWMWDTSP